MNLEEHFKYVGEKRNDLFLAEKEINNYLKFFGERRGMKTALLVDFFRFYNHSVIYAALENLIRQGEISKEQRVIHCNKSECEHTFYVPVYKSFFERVKYCFKIPPKRFW